MNLHVLILTNVAAIALVLFWLPFETLLVFNSAQAGYIYPCVFLLIMTGGLAFILAVTQRSEDHFTDGDGLTTEGAVPAMATVLVIMHTTA